MMDCAEAIDVMGQAVEERLEGGLRASFDHHLAGCGPCRTYFDQLRVTRAALRGLPPPERPADPRRDALVAEFRREFEQGQQGS